MMINLFWCLLDLHHQEILEYPICCRISLALYNSAYDRMLCGIANTYVLLLTAECYTYHNSLTVYQPRSSFLESVHAHAEQGKWSCDREPTTGTDRHGKEAAWPSYAARQHSVQRVSVANSRWYYGTTLGCFTKRNPGHGADRGAVRRKRYSNSANITFRIAAAGPRNQLPLQKTLVDFVL